MNRQQLINELYRYHENELYMKNYYERHGEFIPEALFPKKWNSSILFFDSILDLNAAIQAADSDSHARMADDFLSPSSMDVSISKHPRYSTVFLHDHTFFEILYVYDGNCINTVDGCELTLHKGDFCIIPPKVIHSLAVSNDSIVLNFAILSDTFRTTFSSLCHSNDFLSEYVNAVIYSQKYQKYLLFRAGEDELLADLILDMLLQQVNRQPYRQRIINGLFLVLCGYLLQRHETDIEYPEEYYKINNLADLITNYIVQNYNTVTLESLAEQFHLNPQYMSRLFVQETGKNFKSLVTELRMNKAVSLLTKTDARITDIGLMIGYANPNYFMKLFKNVYGCTPSEYRETHVK